MESIIVIAVAAATVAVFVVVGSGGANGLFSGGCVFVVDVASNCCDCYCPPVGTSISLVVSAFCHIFEILGTILFAYLYPPLDFDLLFAESTFHSSLEQSYFICTFDGSAASTAFY